MPLVWRTEYYFEDLIEIICFDFGDFFIYPNDVLIPQLIKDSNHEIIQDNC